MAYVVVLFAKYLTLGGHSIKHEGACDIFVTKCVFVSGRMDESVVVSRYRRHKGGGGGSFEVYYIERDLYFSNNFP